MAPIAIVDADGWITGCVYTSDALPTIVEHPVGSASTASTSSSSSTAESTCLRPRLEPAALHNAIGVDPKILIGKVLKRISRSPNHPAVTLSFADNTTYQVLVDGYDPRHGSTRVLEMDDLLLRLFDPPGGHVLVDLTVKDCALIQLTDKAYERREWEQRWDQSHIAIAFKFEGEMRWHCVWAMLVEYDDLGCCTFRTFDDVYLQPLERRSPHSPQKVARQPPQSPQKTANQVSQSPKKPASRPPPSPQKTTSQLPQSPKKSVSQLLLPSPEKAKQKSPQKAKIRK